MKARILFVDDDRTMLAIQSRAFGESYEVETAEEVPAALQAIDQRGPYAAIVSDMKMPGCTGIEFFEELRQKAPETVRIMVTGEAKETAIEAVNRGHVFRFLTKPFRQSELRAALEAAVLHYQLVCAERDLLEKTLGASVKVLSEILSMVEPAIFGRTEKLRRYLRQFNEATQIGVRWELDMAATLAPIGLVTLPARRQADSTEFRSIAEEALYASVPQIGHRLVADIPRMERVAQVVLYQNQRFDGAGALDGNSCRGEEIPLGARVIKILSELVLLETRGLSAPGAFAEMNRRQPGCYDPQLLSAAEKVFAPRDACSRTISLLKVKDLRPGQVLVGPICSKDGMLLVAAGSEISEVLLKRLLNFSEITGLREPVEVEAEAA